MLTGKTAFITGAGSGLGRAMASLFAQNGAAIAVADLNPDGARETAKDITKSGGAAEAMALDVRDAVAVEGAVQATEDKFGAVHIVVANAGISLGDSFLETSADDFARVHAVNLAGVFHTLKAGAKAMVARGGEGRLIAMSSVTGLRGCARRAAYGSAKAGVINLVQIVAVELAEQNITANAIAPGPVETPMVKALHTPETRAEWLRTTPRRRYGDARDIAETALFLASPAAAHITGQVIAVDGGWAAAGLIDA